MLADFFSFLESYRGGVLVFLLCLATLALLVQWTAWIFSLGRFRAAVARKDALRNVLADLLVKIIDDFRHLLALVIVLIFALVLAFALIRAGSDIDDITDALQVVTSTMGGLIGSIIGYYFGESAARKSLTSESEEEKSEEVEQESEEEEEGIRAAPAPPEESPDSEDRASDEQQGASEDEQRGDRN